MTGLKLLTTRPTMAPPLHGTTGIEVASPDRSMPSGQQAGHDRFGIPCSHLTEIPAAQHSGTTVRLRQLDQNSIAGVDMTALATFARQYKHLTVAFSTK